MYTLTGDSCYIEDKHWRVYTGILSIGGPRDEVVKKIIGTEVFGKKVLFVESWALNYLSKNMPIGLVIQE